MKIDKGFAQYIQTIKTMRIHSLELVSRAIRSGVFVHVGTHSEFVEYAYTDSITVNGKKYLFHHLKEPVINDKGKATFKFIENEQTVEIESPNIQSLWYDSSIFILIGYTTED